MCLINFFFYDFYFSLHNLRETQIKDNDEKFNLELTCFDWFKCFSGFGNSKGGSSKNSLTWK